VSGLASESWARLLLETNGSDAWGGAKEHEKSPPHALERAPTYGSPPPNGKLSKLFARNSGRLVTRRQLLEKVWGLRDAKSGVVRIFLATILRKLEPDPAHPRYFLTEPGSGIRFVPEGAPGGNAEGDMPG